MTSAKLKEQVKSKIPFYKNGADSASTNKLREVSGKERSDILTLLGCNLSGLTANQVEEKQNEFGLNEIQHEKAPSWFNQLLHSFIFPFNAVLIVIAIISYITDVLIANPDDRDYKTIILLSIMILLSSLIRFWQEYRSNQAAETLKGMIKTTATVLRQEEGK